MDIESILKQMTLEEKAALVSGTDFMYTNPIPRLGIPSLCMSDGPHGLRKQKAGGDNGITASEPATAFPTAVTTASGWNPDNLKRMGGCHWPGMPPLWRAHPAGPWREYQAESPVRTEF